MATVSTPRGEEVSVRRRWLPWPPLYDAQLEEWGAPNFLVSLAGPRGRGDNFTVFLLLTPIVLLFVSLGFLPAMIYTVIVAIVWLGLLFARPWRLEVFVGKTLVGLEEEIGFSRSATMIEQLLARYESGALLTPSRIETKVEEEPISVEVPPTFERGDSMLSETKNFDFEPSPMEDLPSGEQLAAALPRAEHAHAESAVEDLEDEWAPFMTVPEPYPKKPAHQSSNFTIDEDDAPLFPQSDSTPQEPIEPLLPGETPLRRAVRLVEEERAKKRELGEAPPTPNRRDQRAIKRARLKD